MAEDSLRQVSCLVNERTITVAPFSGFCYGVTRACQYAESAIAENEDVYCLGHLIHNPQVVEQMEHNGLRVVDSLAGIRGGVLIIRSHGIEKNAIAIARRQQMTLIDATCPFVKKAREYAMALEAEGYRTVIIGEREHPEVSGLISHLEAEPLVIDRVSSIPADLAGQRVGVVAQTTQAEENFLAITEKLKSLASELRVHNTICDATRKRQKAAIKLAEATDLMIIIGGKNSANTARLAELCRATGTATYHIETSADVKEEWLASCSRIGIAAGASTPGWLIDQLKEHLVRLLETE